MKFGHIVVLRGFYPLVQFHWEQTIFRPIFIWMKFLCKNKLFVRSQNISFFFIGRMYIMSRITSHKFHEFFIFIDWNLIDWNLTSKFWILNFSLYKLQKLKSNFEFSLQFKSSITFTSNYFFYIWDFCSYLISIKKSIVIA